MNQSALIINGATRPGGNTEILVERVVAGARSVNVVPSVVEFRTNQIKRLKNWALQGVQCRWNIRAAPSRFTD